MISTSASIRSACISSKVFTAGPSATIVLEKLALLASPESMYSGIARAAAQARNSAWIAATFLSTGAASLGNWYSVASLVSMIAA